MINNSLLILLCAFMIFQSSFAGIKPVSEEYCQIMQTTDVITQGNPIPCDRLSVVTFKYYNFHNEEDIGNIVVLDVLANNAQKIFEQLFRMKFPINKAVPLDKYNGDDDLSMADNNTSSFNGRKVTGKTDWSLHAYGAAIDINPYQNPFLSFPQKGQISVSPPSSTTGYVNRLNYRPNKNYRTGMAEDVIDVFADHGFLTWGGYWNDPIDYQHFEVGPRSFIEKLIRLPKTAGEGLLKQYIDAYKNCNISCDQQRSVCVAKTQEKFK